MPSYIYGDIAQSSTIQNEMTVRANHNIKTIDDSVSQSTAVVENVVNVTKELNSLTLQLSVLVSRFKVDANQSSQPMKSQNDRHNDDDVPQDSTSNVDFF